MSNPTLDSFHSRRTLKVGSKRYAYYSLSALKAVSLPFSIKILLENLLRREDGKHVTADDIRTLSAWPAHAGSREVAFMPARVLMQDFTGVPAVVDLAAMRDAMKALGGDAKRINPLVPVDLVVDHSVQVDFYATKDAFLKNTRYEYQRNRERYQFLKWGQKAFQDFRAVPPETGIVHQVNLENLATVVFTRKDGKELLAYPDTLVGTDSHTTMINGLGVLGWGVGGIEAEAAMLGQPMSMLIPDVVGFKLHGRLPEGATATDLVLTATQMLRKKGVVGKFVEFYGPGVGALALADRATIANMAPEYGATMGYFPIDARTIEYMTLSGRSKDTVALAEAYAKAQGLFREDSTPDPTFSDTLELDLSTVEASLAGPKRPQDRVTLKSSKEAWGKSLSEMAPGSTAASADVELNGGTYKIGHGSVAIAAITSCTNTSNPSVMLGAGLLAKKAVEKGLKSKPWVKTSLAPGSKVVVDYLKDAKLIPFLEKLNFHVVGFGCTTCIGNSGPLPEPVAEAVTQNKLVVAAVLSGNRNFEGRINPHVKASYLASPPLVVAYALAGRMDIDLTKEPIGMDKKGAPVYLKDIWPTNDEVQAAVKKHLKKAMFAKEYGKKLLAGGPEWKKLKAPAGENFKWDPKSTYVRLPPYFEGMTLETPALADIKDARVLAVLGDSVTTDHISPAGNIAKDSPAGKYLQEKGVQPKDFNSYGSRRGNHEVMVRGTFANIRLRNKLAPGTEGSWTVHIPSGEKMSIFDASMRYQADGVPLLVLAGKEYGSGSSRDWAAKGPSLLGIKAVIAESYERIHRSNLVGMGILPLEFPAGQTAESLGLTGKETFEVEGLASGLKPRGAARVTARGEDGKTTAFSAKVRIDTPAELEYYRWGGILRYVLKDLVAK
jgi:aconitate hydratase